MIGLFSSVAFLLSKADFDILSITMEKWDNG